MVLDSSHSGYITTWLINLDGSDGRLASASEQLDQRAISYTRVAAFDGRNVDPMSVAEYDEARAIKWFGRKLTGGELGCFFSHIDSAKRFLASGAEFGLVLEDDMQMAFEARELIDQLIDWLRTAPRDWEVINLGKHSRKVFTPITEFHAMGAAFTLCRAHYFPTTTTALLWSRSGAQAFVDASQSTFAPVDNFLRQWATQRGTGLAFAQAPIRPSGAASEIDNEPKPARRDKSKRSPLYFWRRRRRLWLDKIRARRFWLARKLA